MIENQDIEFKSIWKDEYLKWICGMANSNGGIIYIGKDDNGKVIGVNHATKLVKEIPNKIKDTMGIIPEIKVEEENNLLYIVIRIDKYPTPISYQGKFYMRSGSNNNEVTGNELDKFLLNKVGKRWENLPIKDASLDDLSEEAFKIFKEKAVGSGRLKKEEVEIDDEILLRNLGLYDGNYLNNAAILLFGKEPHKWIIGSYIKIGFFESNDADLKYQDEIKGPLILQVDNAVDMIYLKYLKALIHYKGMQRIDEYMIPHEGFREILLNSINHKRYESNNPIQVSIYDDKIYVWNEATFPEELMNKNLFEKHYSKPYNPLIAQTFFKAGFIEAWGRGFEKIKKECESYNTPLPSIEINRDGVMIKCTPSETYLQVLNKMHMKSEYSEFTDKFTDKFTDIETKIIELVRVEPTIAQSKLAEKIGISKRTITKNMNNLQERKVIERIGNNKRGHWEVLLDKKN